MLDFQQKRKVRSLMYNRITVGVLGVLALLFIHSTWQVYKKKIESEEQRNISLEHVQELRDRDSELKSQMASLETTAGVEAEIRSKFSVAKDNENMVVIISDDDAQSSTTVPAASIWSRIRGWLTGSTR